MGPLMASRFSSSKALLKRHSNFGGQVGVPAGPPRDAGVHTHRPARWVRTPVICICAVAP